MGLPSYCLRIPWHFFCGFYRLQDNRSGSDPYHCSLILSSYHTTLITNINLPTCFSDCWTGCFLSFEPEIQLVRRFRCTFDAIITPIKAINLRSIRFLARSYSSQGLKYLRNDQGKHLSSLPCVSAHVLCFDTL